MRQCGGVTAMIMRIYRGKRPANLAVGACYSAVRPEFGATWQLRAQMTFIF